MHLQTEKLELLLADLQSHNPGASDKFIRHFFRYGAAIPPPETKLLADRLYDFAKQRATNDPVLFAQATFSLALADFVAGRFESTLKYDMEAYRLFAELKNEAGMGLCAATIGAAYRSLGDIELGLKYLTEGIELPDKTKLYTHIKIASTLMLGEIYSDSLHFDDAMKYLNITHANALEENDMDMAASTLSGIGIIYLREKKYSLSLESLNKALKISEEFQLPSIKSRVLTGIGTFYFEQELYDDAIKNYREALSIREELKMMNAAITNMLQIGEASMKLGRYDEALVILNRALGLAEEINLKFKIYQLHFVLSKIYKAQGNFQESLMHFEIYERIKTEVNREDAEKKLNNHKIVMEAEQTKKENATIKKQKAEIEQKNRELLDTIDQLTRAKISKKARAYTIVIAVFFFILKTLFWSLY